MTKCNMRLINLKYEDIFLKTFMKLGYETRSDFNALKENLNVNLKFSLQFSLKAIRKVENAFAVNEFVKQIVAVIMQAFNKFKLNKTFVCFWDNSEKWQHKFHEQYFHIFPIIFVLPSKIITHRHTNTYVRTHTQTLVHRQANTLTRQQLQMIYYRDIINKYINI